LGIFSIIENGSDRLQAISEVTRNGNPPSTTKRVILALGGEMFAKLPTGERDGGTPY